MNEDKLGMFMEWMAKNTELAYKEYPDYMNLMEEAALEMPPYVTANITQSIPENLVKWDKEIEDLLPSTKRKKITEYLELINILLNKYHPSTEIEKEALKDVKNELIEMREYFINKRLQIDSEINPNSNNHINWLKSVNDKSLEQFINALQEQSLIKARDTEAIIQEHFKPQRGQNKEPEPIEWLEYQNLLVYLFRNLYKKYFINPAGKKWQIVSKHFIKQNGEQYKVRSLTVEANKQKEGVLPANGTNTIDKIVDRLIAD